VATLTGPRRRFPARLRFERVRERLIELAHRLNGERLPLYLDRADRAELQRTIDG
jgi:hypothetical protein